MKGSVNGTADALDATIGGMFEIPEADLDGQTTDSLTFGATSAETGRTDTQPEEVWNPLADF